MGGWRTEDWLLITALTGQEREISRNIAQQAHVGSLRPSLRHTADTSATLRQSVICHSDVKHTVSLSALAFTQRLTRIQPHTCLHPYTPTSRSAHAALVDAQHQRRLDDVRQRIHLLVAEHRLEHTRGLSERRNFPKYRLTAREICKK